MQLNRPKNLTQAAGIAGLMVLCLSGCNQAASEAASGTSASSQSNAISGLSSYELVLATRPEKPELYYAHIKPFHELCALAAQQLKVPVKPFLTLPANFVVERRTIATDGRNRLDKTEGSGLGGSQPTLSPDSGCATELGKSSNAQMTSNGKRQDIAVASNGTTAASPIEILVDMPPAKPQDLSDYSIKKTVLGHPVRCLGAANPVITSQLLLEACIYDGPSNSTLRDEEGKAILVYSRQYLPVGNKGAPTVLVTEPVALSVGKPLDAALFKLREGAK